ncbi:alpha/beta fold hydrolase [Streptosporangium sp. OZ121]|uniref:alpha/beta fold hydrolase n=1 Tax=Streptosporangium sp. OZ121 TaxID=3444183 RepID=UPI003F7AC56A
MSDIHQRYHGDLAADGHGTDGDQPAPVLLHGLGADRHQWESVIRELARHDPERRAVSLDLPGHGES